MRAPGTPSSGCAAGSAQAPQISLAEAVLAQLAGWQGDAARQLVSQVELVREFGNQVGLTMYDHSAGGSTLHSALSVVQVALAEINTRYLEYKSAYKQWSSALASLLASYGHQGAGPSRSVRYLAGNWANTTIETVIKDIRQPNCTISFTIYDETERHAIEVAGTVVTAGRLAVFRASAAPGEIERQLVETFTQRYKNHVGPLADMITSPSGCYSAAARLLPVKVDGSALPHAQQGPGGTSASLVVEIPPAGTGSLAGSAFAPTHLADVGTGVPDLGAGAGSADIGPGPVFLGGLGAGGLVAARMGAAGPAGQPIPIVPLGVVDGTHDSRQRSPGCPRKTPSGTLRAMPWCLR